MTRLKPGLHGRRKHKHKHKKPTCKPGRRTHKRLVPALMLMLASSRFTRTTQRRKHKRKEWKMKNSDKLSAYNLTSYSCVAIFGHVGIKSWLLLRLPMSRYVYAYRTCKHPCACAYAHSYACVVRVNQA